MSPPQNANASAETGEFPALLIHCVNGKPTAFDILQGDGDLWSKTYPIGQPNVTSAVVPMELILRAHKLEAALSELVGYARLQEPAWCANLIKQAQAALKGGLSA